MDWQAPPPNFSAVQLERVNPAKNEARFYYLAWQPTLFGGNAVVRMWGRKRSNRFRLLSMPFPSLAEAWPTIRRLVKTRLRHGYQIIEEH